MSSRHLLESIWPHLVTLKLCALYDPAGLCPGLNLSQVHAHVCYDTRARILVAASQVIATN